MIHVLIESFKKTQFVDIKAAPLVSSFKNRNYEIPSVNPSNYVCSNSWFLEQRVSASRGSDHVVTPHPPHPPAKTRGSFRTTV